MKLFTKLLLVALLALPAFAIPPQTSLFTATLKNGSGSVIPTAYLHFELWNCGTNFPEINGQPATIAQFTFDLKANPSTGLISGFVTGNDDILCGNIPSTEWIITPMFGQNQPFGPSHKYVICDSAIPAGQSFCSNTVFGTAAFASLLPTDGYPPPSPGFNVVYANPTASQTQTQPALTEMNYVGTYNFCSATVLCGGGGGGGGTLTSITTNLPLTGCAAPCTSTANLGINNATGAAVGVLQLTGDLGGTATAPTVVNGSNITNSSIPNSGLVHTGVTVTAGTGLTGGGTVALGGTITLNSTVSGGGNPVLENCTPDNTGYVGYSVAALTNYQYGHWEYTFSQASAIYCTVYIPTAQSGATFVLDIAANDATAGHTANFQTCDQVVTSGTINVGSFTCAANQAFTTTSTAWNRVSLTFNVQSTLSNGSILLVEIATSTTGTAPTANMFIYPHFIL